jgi:hypothetical protein
VPVETGVHRHDTEACTVSACQCAGIEPSRIDMQHIARLRQRASEAQEAPRPSQMARPGSVSRARPCTSAKPSMASAVSATAAPETRRLALPRYPPPLRQRARLRHGSGPAPAHWRRRGEWPLWWRLRWRRPCGAGRLRVHLHQQPFRLRLLVASPVSGPRPESRRQPRRAATLPGPPPPPCRAARSVWAGRECGAS